jgi:hypothetical protein
MILRLMGYSIRLYLGFDPKVVSIFNALGDFFVFPELMI